MVVRTVYTVEIIYLEIFVDSVHFVLNMYIAEIFQHTLFIEIMFVIVYILKEFLNERKKDNQSFVIFVVFRIKQSVNKIEKIPKF